MTALILNSGDGQDYVRVVIVPDAIATEIDTVMATAARIIDTVREANDEYTDADLALAFEQIGWTFPDVISAGP